MAQGLGQDITIDLAFANSRVYAAQGAYICVSSDGGATWSVANSGGMQVAISTDGITLYSDKGGVSYSNNDGSSWRSTGLPNASNTHIGNIEVSGGKIYATTNSGDVYKRQRDANVGRPVLRPRKR